MVNFKLGNEQPNGVREVGISSITVGDLGFFFVALSCKIDITVINNNILIGPTVIFSMYGSQDEPNES